jgi:hypothetical protein
MKCIRTGNSPCARCQRARRACCPRPPSSSDTFEVVLKTPENFYKPKPSRPSRPSTRTRYKRGNGKSNNSKNAPIPRDQQITELGRMKNNVDKLPSIYSTAPFRTVLEDDYVEHALSLESISPEIILSTPPSTLESSGSISSVLDSRLPTAELKQLMKMCVWLCGMLGSAKHYRFCTRLLPSIPIFTKDDFENPELLIEQQPELVHSICYVTSKFLPGGLPTAQSVYPLVLQFVQERTTGALWPGKAGIECFRALVVLYAFSEAAHSNVHSPHSPYMLPAQLIKTVTEMYGTQLGLHRSVDAIRSILSLPSHELTSNISYKRYTYWLWLFTMSHQ